VTDRLRLTVAGPEDLVVEIGPEDGITASPVADVREVTGSGTARPTDGRLYEVTIDGWVLRVGVQSAARADLLERAARVAAQPGKAARAVVKAQIPGRIVRVWVAAGDVVEAGQRLLAIEAMKMENEVRAPRPGTVESVGVGPGTNVELGDELVIIG
jgi:oxaloacetate decarboxylase alpha subunit